MNTNSQRAEHLTLAVLISGVAALALSDFVSPIYWSLPVIAALLRMWQGPSMALSEMQASMIGWAGFLWVGFELISGRAWVVAFTDFMLILALAVVVEAPTPRNYLHRLLTGTFLILAAAVLTDSFLYILPLATFMWFTWRAASCLYNQGFSESPPTPTPIRQDLQLILMLTVGVALLFILLPRFNTFSHLKGVQPRMATGGFSNQVELGSFARSLDSRVAFRVEPINIKPLSFQKTMIGRYWRGITLSRYTGHGWRQQQSSIETHISRREELEFQHQTSDRDITLAVFREASDHAFIFLPDGLKKIHPLPYRAKLDDSGNTRFINAPSRRLRILMTLDQQHHSYLQLRGPKAIESDTSKIPAALHQWVQQQLGDQPTADSRSMQQLQQALLQWTYDLNVELDEQQPVTSFIQNRRGHCELFATTLALAARSIGLPARVVNGYFGGSWNETGKFIIMRQQEAHSWTEVWLDARWQRFDATPPSRWSLSSIRFPQFDDVWESVRLSWYRYVLEFQNNDRQLLFQQIITWLRTALPWVILTAIVLAGTWWLWRYIREFRSRQRPNRQMRILDRWLNRQGIHHSPWQPIRMIPPPEKINAKAWQQWLSSWERQCYDDSQQAWTTRELRQSLKQLIPKSCNGSCI